MIVGLLALWGTSCKKGIGVAMQPTDEQRAIHDRAVALGLRHYVDPETGYWVFTAIQLKDKGACCGQGCRHCPWSTEEQRRAGRPGA